VRDSARQTHEGNMKVPCCGWNPQVTCGGYSVGMGQQIWHCTRWCTWHADGNGISHFISFCFPILSAFVYWHFHVLSFLHFSHFAFLICCIFPWSVMSHRTICHVICHIAHHSYTSLCYGLTVQTPSSLVLSLPLTITTFLVVPAHSLNSD